MCVAHITRKNRTEEGKLGCWGLLSPQGLQPLGLRCRLPYFLPWFILAGLPRSLTPEMQPAQLCAW